MKFIFKLLTALLSENAAKKVVDNVKDGLSPLAPYMRKVSVGVTMVIVSAFTWSLTVALLLAGLFLHLGKVDAYVAPALWTGFACFGISLILVIGGLRIIKAPR
jgi:hypothetical protein